MSNFRLVIASTLTTLILTTSACSQNVKQSTDDLLGKKYVEVKTPSVKVTEYNFASPDKILKLPSILNEVSGLTLVNDHTFASVQDEKGIIFLYDFNKEELVNQYEFRDFGDFEGLTLTGDNMYVLEANGDLHEVINYTSSTPKINVYPSGNPAKDNEGLCHDEVNNRLLIGPKSKLRKDDSYYHAVYGFDLATKKMIEKPVYEFNLKEVEEFILKNDIQLADPRVKEGKSIMRFKTSAIAINPVDQKLYLLSSKDHLLLVFNEDGSISNVQALDAKLYNQAEGITFLPNGDMLISNEKGDNQTATVFYIKRNT